MYLFVLYLHAFAGMTVPSTVAWDYGGCGRVTEVMYNFVEDGKWVLQLSCF